MLSQNRLLRHLSAVERNLTTTPSRKRSHYSYGMRKLISSGSELEKQYGYSRAVVQDNFCFVAGTTGPNPDGSGFSDDVVTQVKNAFAIVEKAIATEGFALTDCVRAVYYITAPEYWSAIQPVLAEKFGEIRPAATCVIAGLVNPAMKFEVELTLMR
ncbi:MAG: hypothetical protein RL441_807 [Actinomycetota bacterium]